MTIKKGTIVWYWHKNLKEWKRGKVIAVNRYYLTVKCRQTRELYTVPSYQTAIPASESKPTRPAPASLTEAWQRRGYEWVDGILKKVRRPEKEN